MIIKKKIKLLKKNGYVVIENVFTKKFCENHIIKFEKILKDRIKKNKYIGKKN